MKRFNGKCRCFYRDFSGIHLVDKCLIVFMAVLLTQSAYSLIAGEAWAARSSDVDVIVRTSAASIFGYFLSANFINRSSGETGETGQRRGESPEGMRLRGSSLEEVQRSADLPEGEPLAPELEPDFATGGELYSDSGGEPDCAPLPDRDAEVRLQILVAAGIGLFCLAALILLRNIGGYGEDGLPVTAAATVTQFRDFVSGCVGFLIGCPTSRAN